MPGLFTMILGAALMVCLSATSAFAQWITLRTPGIPRAASGEVDLLRLHLVPATGAPDFSGLWGWQPGRYFVTVAADLKPEEIAPWAQELRASRMEAHGKDDLAMYGCLPQGPRMNTFAPLPVKIGANAAAPSYPLGRLDVSADLSRRPLTPCQSRSVVHGLFRWTLGRRHTRG